MLFNIFFHFFSANSPMPKALNTTRKSIKLPNKKQLGTNSTASYKTKGARYYRHSSFKTLSTPDRKSTRLNSSHVAISYAVFCLKKKKKYKKKKISTTTVI